MTANHESSGKHRAAWFMLLASAVLEAVWATALGLSDGLTRQVPSLVFVGAAVLSMWGLGLAVKRIPLGTAYAGLRAGRGRHRTGSGVSRVE